MTDLSFNIIVTSGKTINLTVSNSFSSSLSIEGYKRPHLLSEYDPQTLGTLDSLTLEEMDYYDPSPSNKIFSVCV